MTKKMQSEIVSGSWAEDLAAESHLHRLGVEFKFVKNVPMYQIDVEGSRENNARITNKYDSELAFEYACAMELGDVFPAPVLRPFRFEGFKFRTLSGNHRVGAASDRNYSVIDAYVLTTQDEELCDIVTRTANRWMGDRQSKEEAVLHCRVIMEKYGRTAVEVAKMFGLKEKFLQQSLRAEAMRDKMLDWNIKGAGVAKATLDTLSTLSQNENVCRNASRVVVKHKVPVQRASQFTREIREQKTEGDQLRVVKKWEAMLTEERPRKVTSSQLTKPTRSTFLRNLNGLANYLDSGNQGGPFTSLDQLQITAPADRSQIHSTYKDVKATLDTLFREAQQRHQQRKRGGTQQSKRRRKRGVA